MIALEAWLAAQEAWLAAPEAWLAASEAWLVAPEASLVAPEAWLAASEAWLEGGGRTYGRTYGTKSPYSTGHRPFQGCCPKSLASGPGSLRHQILGLKATKVHEVWLGFPKAWLETVKASGLKRGS